MDTRDFRKRLGGLAVPPDGRERAVDAARAAAERAGQSRRGSRRQILAIASVALAALIATSFTPPGEAATSWVGRLVGVEGKTTSGASLKGMVPLSVTFVSHNEGWMLGGLGCDERACRQAVLRTVDYGHSWDQVSRLTTRAPRDLPPGQAGVEGLGTPETITGIRFADADNGWMFGSGLYATHDGGRSWEPLHLPGFVTDVEAWNGRVYALVASCETVNEFCSGGRLYETTAESDQFRPVSGLQPFTDPDGRGFSASIVLHGFAAYVVFRTESAATLAASTDGRSWVMRDLPCRTWWGSNTGLSELAAWSETGLVLACGAQPGAGTQLKAVYESTDAGVSWRKAGEPDPAGYVSALAAASADDWYIATLRGPIQATTDGGQTWRTGPPGPGLEGFRWVGATDDTHAVALAANEHASAAWFTETGPGGWYTHSW